MPFTLAHPAAVIPFFYVLRQRLVLSALVIGSLIPDVWYLAPGSLRRDDTHSVYALLWPCLPMGLVAYAIFHLFLKRPAAALLPARAQGRFVPLLARPGLPAASFWVVAASILLGAATHVVWDSFTHSGGRLVEALPFLQERWFQLGKAVFPAYRAIQYMSTALGLLAVWLWARRWLRDSDASDAPGGIEERLRVAAVSGTLGIAVGFALHAAMLQGFSRAPLFGFFPLLRRAGIAGLEGLLVALVAWSVAWHVVVRRDSSSAHR